MERLRTADGVRPPAYVIAGGVYVDTLHEVESFPQEDSCTRALSVKRRRGGNAATTACVLAQLAPHVSWMGCVPEAGDAEAVAFVLDELNGFGVDTHMRERVAGENLGLPAAMILVSRATATRTIVSSRRGLRELSPSHFATHLPDDSPDLWAHLEVREYATVAQMVSTVAARRASDASAARWRLSVEIEKPALTPEQVCELICDADCVFFSREWIEAHAGALAPGEKPVSAEQTLRGLLNRHPSVRERLPGGTVWFCGWGSHGAYAINPRTETVEFEPAIAVANVADTTGAGDTFIAACIAALSQGERPSATESQWRSVVRVALRCGCAVAGQKVSQDGFENLRSAYSGARQRQTQPPAP